MYAPTGDIFEKINTAILKGRELVDQSKAKIGKEVAKNIAPAATKTILVASLIAGLLAAGIAMTVTRSRKR